MHGPAVGLRRGRRWEGNFTVEIQKLLKDESAVEILRSVPGIGATILTVILSEAFDSVRKAVRSNDTLRNRAAVCHIPSNVGFRREAPIDVRRIHTDLPLFTLPQTQLGSIRLPPTMADYQLSRPSLKPNPTVPLRMRMNIMQKAQRTPAFTNAAMAYNSGLIPNLREPQATDGIVGMAPSV